MHTSHTVSFTSTTTTTTQSFSQDDILAALLETGRLKVDRSTFADLDGVKVTMRAHVRVPGGGDYSNCNLDLDDHHVIVTV